MDISKEEQRILHVLAQGGRIHVFKTDAGRIAAVKCYNRDGWLLNACTVSLFQKLRRRKAIRSLASKPYEITRRGLELVRSEVDNR